MKKAVIFITLIFTLSVLIAGCGSTSQPAQQNTQNTQTAEQPKVSYPEKPIQVIVPAGPGGDTDTYVRLASKYINKYLGQNFVVVNMEGGGGSIGTKKVLDSAPDGYTVLFYHPSMILNQVFGVTDYGIEDFEQGPILVVDYSNSFVVNADSSYKTVKDLVDAAKANPGKIKFGTEIGGFTYVQGLAFNKMAGVELNMVDVGGQSAKNAALEGKQVDVIPSPAGIVRSFVDAGDFKLIGVMSDSRLEAFPDVPTFKEEGVDLVMGKPYFFMFPKGTPKDVVDKFNDAIKQVANDPDFAKDLSQYLLKPNYMTPEDAHPFLKDMQKFFEDLAATAKK